MSNSFRRQHGQDRRFAGRLRRFIVPEDRGNAKRFFLLNQAGEVVAEDFTQHFVDHRGIRLAGDRIAELSLDRRERAFQISQEQLTDLFSARFRS